MDKKPILKNLNKFSNIKLARGVNLLNLSSVSRSHDELRYLGVSTKTFGKNWFVLPDKSKAIFKSYDFSSSLGLKKLRIINEVLCYQLAKQVGMPCARYEPAHIQNKVGLISYNFLKKGETLKTLHELLKVDKVLDSNLSDTLNALEMYGDYGYNYNKKEILKELFKFIVFDTITIQSDRHSNNIHFIFNEKKSEIKLAPAFDNEFAFSIDLIYNNYKNDKSTLEKSIDDVRKDYSKWAKYFTILEELRSPRNAFINNVHNICAMAKADKELGKVLNNILDNINPSEAFKVLENNDYKISKEYKEFVETVVSENVKIIRSELENVNQEDTEYFKEEIIR
ncbi:MAG: HipA domain-containing protein [Clostridia bacterium]|nr:HipA domain-containing protein [Clostridia bacterium]